MSKSNEGLRKIYRQSQV